MVINKSDFDSGAEGLSDEELDSLVFLDENGKPFGEELDINRMNPAEEPEKQADDGGSRKLQADVYDELLAAVSGDSDAVVIDLDAQDVDSPRSTDGLPWPGVSLDLSKQVTMRLRRESDRQKKTSGSGSFSAL